MDLIDRIETTRFLGAEFLCWLWFKTELYGHSLEVQPMGAIDLIFESPLTLTDWLQETEKVVLKGASPSESVEASSALRQGKVPTQAALRIAQGSDETRFTLIAPKLALSGVKLPAVLQSEGDEVFFERMRLLEQLDATVKELYREFITLRLSDLWESELAPAMRAWVKGKESLTPRAYAGLLKRAR